MFGNSVLQAMISTARADAARAFYQDVLGLRLVSEDQFALLFAAQIGFLRIAKAPAVAPAASAILAFDVPDLDSALDALAAKGVAAERFPFLQHDAKGAWTAPDGARVAWFRDPDYNLLSAMQRAA